jgi:hypothetical protein
MPEKRLSVEMGGRVRKQLLALGVLVILLLGHGLAHATRSFSYAQTPTPPTAIFSMGSTQSLSYLITNTNTAGNAGERIYQVRIRINSGSTFSAATVAPAGWTLTTRTTTTLTFTASTWANAIASGASQNFTIVVLMRKSAADVNDKLRDIRSGYTTSATGAFVSVGPTTSTVAPPPAPPTLPSAAGTWMLNSLTITSFQIVDAILGTPISSLAAGGNFKLVMTVQNNSTATQSGIVSNPNPITTGAVKTGTVTQVLTGTTGSPLTLTAGASGTITYTFSTAALDSGTIYFTASAQKSATVTSASATSPTLTVSPCIFSANITASATCLYAGQNISLTMLLTNSCAAPLTTVTPSLSTTGPATLVSGPTPPTIASIAAGGGTASVGWVYQINSAAATNPFTFTGSATSASPVKTTPAAASPSIQRGQFDIALTPSVTNASSTNVELDWDVTNNGCAAANSVAVTFPAGWVWANDAYSLVNLNATTAVETWVASGANPVTFTSPNIPNQLPLTFDADFFLVFSATPAGAGTSIFSVNVTDANGLVVSVPVSVTVNPYADADGLNNVNNNSWREQFP